MTEFQKSEKAIDVKGIKVDSGIDWNNLSWKQWLGGFTGCGGCGGTTY